MFSKVYKPSNSEFTFFAAFFVSLDPFEEDLDHHPLRCVHGLLFQVVLHVEDAARLRAVWPVAEVRHGEEVRSADFCPPRAHPPHVQSIFRHAFVAVGARWLEIDVFR